MPRFSIIVPCHNAARHLAATLATIQDQTDPDWEAIFVDDGSTDDTAAILASAARHDPRIHVMASGGRGPSVARNLGALGRARCDVLLFL